MPNSLHPDWRADRSLLIETSDWITTRPAWGVRWAPLLGTLVLTALTVWACLIPVAVSSLVTVSVLSGEVAPQGGSRLILATAGVAEVLPVIGQQVTLRLNQAGEGRVKHIHGTVTDLQTVGFTLRIGLATQTVTEFRGTGQLLVPNRNLPLSRVLLSKLQAPGGLI